MQHEEVSENITVRYYQQIAAELAIGKAQVAATAGLLAEGGTVPFTASRHDPEPHGRAIYEMIVASGVAIGAYVEPAGLPDTGALPTKLA